MKTTVTCIGNIFTCCFFPSLNLIESGCLSSNNRFCKKKNKKKKQPLFHMMPVIEKVERPLGGDGATFPPEPDPCTSLSVIS